MLSIKVYLSIKNDLNSYLSSNDELSISNQQILTKSKFCKTHRNEFQTATKRRKRNFKNNNSVTKLLIEKRTKNYQKEKLK